jgi:hypothetical protein
MDFTICIQPIRSRMFPTRPIRFVTKINDPNNTHIIIIITIIITIIIIIIIIIIGGLFLTVGCNEM